MSATGGHLEAKYEGRERLIELLGIIGREIESIPNARTAPSHLAESWAELVKTLAIEPEPARRACPKCGAVGMLAATLCGSCWSRLSPQTVGAERQQEKAGE